MRSAVLLIHLLAFHFSTPTSLGFEQPNNAGRSNIRRQSTFTNILDHKFSLAGNAHSTSYTRSLSLSAPSSLRSANVQLSSSGHRSLSGEDQQSQGASSSAMVVSNSLEGAASIDERPTSCFSSLESIWNACRGHYASNPLVPTRSSPVSKTSVATKPGSSAVLSSSASHASSSACVCAICLEEMSISSPKNEGTDSKEADTSVSILAMRDLANEITFLKKLNSMAHQSPTSSTGEQVRVELGLERSIEDAFSMQALSLPCGHIFHRLCLLEHELASRQNSPALGYCCPLCKKGLPPTLAYSQGSLLEAASQFVREFIRNIVIEEMEKGTSSKSRILMKIRRNLRERLKNEFANNPVLLAHRASVSLVRYPWIHIKLPLKPERLNKEKNQEFYEARLLVSTDYD